MHLLTPLFATNVSDYLLHSSFTPLTLVIKGRYREFFYYNFRYYNSKYTDSQPILKALATHMLESKLIWEYGINVTTKNSESLICVSGHTCVKEFEKQDADIHFH